MRVKTVKSIFVTKICITFCNRPLTLAENKDNMHVKQYLHPMNYSDFYKNRAEVEVVTPAELAHELEPLRRNMVRGHYRNKTGTWSQLNGNPNELPCCFGAHIMRLFDDYDQYGEDGYGYGALYLRHRLGVTENQLYALLSACGAPPRSFHEIRWKTGIDEFLDRMSHIKKVPPKANDPYHNLWSLTTEQESWKRNVRKQYKQTKLTKPTVR